MNVTNKLLVLFVLLVVAGACGKETGDADQSGNGKPVRTRWALKIFPLGEVPVRAVEESQVTDMWVLQFDGTDDASVLVGEPQYISSGGGMNPSGFDVTLTANAAQSVWFVANTGNGSLFAQGSRPADLAALKNTVLDVSENDLNADGSRLPMTGCYAGDIVAGSSLTVDLQRTAAKIEFGFVPEFPAEMTFKATCVTLRNVPVRATYATPVTGAPAAPDNVFPAAETALYTDYTPVTGSVPALSVWYMPENLRGTGTASDSKLKNAATAPEGQGAYCTYIQLEGELSNTVTGEVKYVVYKIYAGADAVTDYNLMRNNRYRITTRLLGADLSDTRVEVYGSLTAGIAPPGGVDNGIGMVPGTLMTAAANCYMAMPGQTIVFDPYKGVGNVANPHIPVGSIASVEILWQTRDSDPSGTLALGGASAVAYKSGVVSVSTNPATSGGNAVIAARDAQNTILWSWHIWVTDYQPWPGTFALPYTTRVTHSYAGDSWYSGGAFYNKVIMDRNLGATTTFYAAPNAASEGPKAYGMLYQWGRKDPFPPAAGTSPFDNGQIKPLSIYDASGTELTEGQASSFEDHTYTGVRYVYSIALCNLNNSIIDPLAFLYVPTSSASKNWYCLYGGSDNNFLWESQEGAKTIYDPCPAGWRVPRGASKAGDPLSALTCVWAGFTTGSDPITGTGYNPNAPGHKFDFYYEGNRYLTGSVARTATSGRLYTGKSGDNSYAWYPAGGGRSGYTGQLEDTGEYGTLWTATSTRLAPGATSYLFDYYPGNVSNSSSYRMHAYSVRCVKE